MAAICKEDPPQGNALQDDDITDYDDDDDDDDYESLEDDEIISKIEEHPTEEPCDDSEPPKMPTVIEVNPNKAPPEKDYYFEDDGSTIATLDTYKRLVTAGTQNTQWTIEVQQEEEVRRQLRALQPYLGHQNGQQYQMPSFLGESERAYGGGVDPDEYYSDVRASISLEDLSAQQRQFQMMQQFEADQRSTSSTHRYPEQMDHGARGGGNAQWNTQLQHSGPPSADRRALIGMHLLGRPAPLDTLGETKPEFFRQPRSMDNLITTQGPISAQSQRNFGNYPGSMDNLRAHSFYQHPMESVGQVQAGRAGATSRAPILPQRSSSGRVFGTAADKTRVLPQRSVSADGVNFFNLHLPSSAGIAKESAEDKEGTRDSQWLAREISRRSVFSAGSHHGADPPGWDSSHEIRVKDSGDEYSSSESEYVSDFYGDDDDVLEASDSGEKDDAENTKIRPASKEEDSSESSVDEEGSLDQMMSKLHDLKKRRSARPPSARFVVSGDDMKPVAPLKTSCHRSEKNSSKRDDKNKTKKAKTKSSDSNDQDSPESKKDSKLQSDEDLKKKKKPSSSKHSDGKDKKKKSSNKKHQEDDGVEDSDDDHMKSDKTKKASSKKKKDEKKAHRKDESKRGEHKTKSEGKGDDDKKKKKDEDSKLKKKSTHKDKEAKVKESKKDHPIKDKQKSLPRADSSCKVSDHTGSTRSTFESDMVSRQTKSYVFDESDVSNLLTKQSVWGGL